MRLKEEIDLSPFLLLFLFQYQKVRLKEDVAVADCQIAPLFQYQKVRLKVPCMSANPASNCEFQYQKVRLKVKTKQNFLSLEFVSIPKGAIEGGFNVISFCLHIWFQYQKVRLKGLTPKPERY